MIAWSHTSKIVCAGLVGIVFGFHVAPARAQLDKLFKAIQDAAPKMGLPSAPGAAGGGGKNSILAPEQWCKQQAGAIGEIEGNTSLISSEFRIANLESLQDEFQKAFDRRNISRTFPDAKFFKRSFETSKVRSLYDVFLNFPEPATLAVLIEHSRGRDEQERGDALMALAFLHMQAPQLSVDANRWSEHFKAASAHEQYTAFVFRARMNAFGEYGPKNTQQALGFLLQANGLASKYRNSGTDNASGIKMEFDSYNLAEAVNKTGKELYAIDPGLFSKFPMKGMYDMVEKIEAAKKAYADKFPSTSLGKKFAEVEKINKKSIDIGDEIIKMSQGGNRALGEIASLKSLQGSKEGDKQTFINIDIPTQQAHLKFIAKQPALSGEQKKKMGQAQELRYVVQGTLAQLVSELVAELFSGFGIDIAKMAGPQEALNQFNDVLIQSCGITSKWEQAMRAKDVPPGDKKTALPEVGNVIGKYNDKD